MKRSCLLGAAYALCLSLMISGAANASIIYHVDRTIGDGTVTGFIETDGTLDVLSSGNIIDWTFKLTAENLFGGQTDVIDIEDDGSVHTIIDGAITATATQLWFNFGLVDTSYLIFQGGEPYFNYWCLETSGCGGSSAGEVMGNRVGGIGIAQSESRTGNIAFAEVVPVPAAVWLFGSGLLGLVGIARRKKSAIQ